MHTRDESKILFFNIYLRAGSNHYLFIHQLRSSILPAGKMLSDQICYVLYILFLEQRAKSKLRDFFSQQKRYGECFQAFLELDQVLN